jgi:bifunctional UDP-N-acetylglucosamine pyrophosphorylase/glucosamine-1-phosphate N-acetyltransferase
MLHSLEMAGSRFRAVLLAAGRGTRMRSNRAKVLHSLLGEPLLENVLRAVEAAGAASIVIVVGHDAGAVQAAFAGRGEFVLQDPPLGTGHAVLAARARLAERPELPTLVLNGDLPLLSDATLSRLLRGHRERRAAATLLTAFLADASAYGRVVRDEQGRVRAIVEAKDATPEVLALREINAGAYVFETPLLLEALDSLVPQNAQGEYYLTDVVAGFVGRGLPVEAVVAEDPSEALGVNTLAELAALTRLLRERRLAELMAAGVVVDDPANTWVERRVSLEPDSVLRPFTLLEGRTVVRAGAVVGPFARVVNSEIGAGARVLDHCLLLDCVVGAGASVGPFAHVRPETVIGARAKVGNFVELKKTRLGDGSKAPHLSYLGDAEIGAGVNIGAGTITCNYDGEAKHATRIDAGAFIGSDATLVAPVTIGAGAYVAAGSAITEDVPADALALGRARQVTKPGWARTLRERRATTKAKA